MPPQNLAHSLGPCLELCLVICSEECRLWLGTHDNSGCLSQSCHFYNIILLPVSIKSTGWTSNFTQTREQGKINNMTLF